MCIKDLRKNIDEIDDQIIFLLEKRFEVCDRIGAEKRKFNVPIESRYREQEILEKITKTDYKYSKEISEIFKDIFCKSKNLQRCKKNTKHFKSYIY